MQPRLIKTIEQVNAQVPVNMTSQFETIAPFLRGAEGMYVLRVIGKAQFEALKELAGEDMPDEDDPKGVAISLCHKIAANLGYYAGLPVLAVSIGTSGIQVLSNTDTKQAFQWQVEDLKNALVEIGFNAIEELLIHLEEFPEAFPEYHDSEEFLKLQDYLIPSAAIFDEHFDIAESRFVFQALLYIMKRVEQQVVGKVIGQEFLNKLKKPGISEKQKILVNDYLRPGIALLTAAKAIIERVITFKNGIAAYNFRGNYENMKESMPADRQQVQATYDQLTTDGNQYLQDGLKYINENLGDMTGFEPPPTRRRFKITNDPGKGIFAT